MRKTQHLQNSRSNQPKPKIIYKNLQQIIFKSQLQKKWGSHYDTESHDKDAKQSKKFKTQVLENKALKQSNYLNKSNIKLSNTSSRHSLKSKQKLNCPVQKENTEKIISKNNSFKKNLYNRTDAIFTDLEDFLRETKETMLHVLQHKNDAQLYQKELQNLESAIQSFKKQINGINYVKQIKDQTKQCLKQQKIEKVTQFKCFQEYLMNRQGTLSSTINGEQNNYIATQTDQQLMNCLIFKNKVNRNKQNRKLHITQQSKGKSSQKSVYQLVLQQNKRKKSKI